jgi:hypothetical protein
MSCRRLFTALLSPNGYALGVNIMIYALTH